MSLKPIMKSAADAHESEAVNCVTLWPAERVQEIFDRLKAVRGTDREAAELRIFAERMIWLYENQSDAGTYWPDTAEELIRLAAYGEALLDAERTKDIEARL